MKNRKGIAMIELIFAIVIMSFVMLSLPIIMMQVKQSTDLAIKQESIALISSQVNLILTHHWDDVQTRGNNSSYILKTNSGNKKIEFNPLTNLKGNRVTFKTSRRYSTESLFASDVLTLEKDKDSIYLDDDIDDFNNKKMTLTIEASESASESKYLDTKVNLNTVVSYAKYVGDMSDPNIVLTNGGVSVVSTNIKSVNTLLTTPNSKTKIRLKGFSTNIGGYNSETLGGF